MLCSFTKKTRRATNCIHGHDMFVTACACVYVWDRLFWINYLLGTLPSMWEMTVRVFLPHSRKMVWWKTPSFFLSIHTTLYSPSGAIIARYSLCAKMGDNMSVVAKERCWARGCHTKLEKLWRKGTRYYRFLNFSGIKSFSFPAGGWRQIFCSVHRHVLNSRQKPTNMWDEAKLCIGK